MKTLEINVSISDEDYEAFKNNKLHIRVYYRKDGDVLCVSVPEEKQDLLDKEMYNDILFKRSGNEK